MDIKKLPALSYLGLVLVICAILFYLTDVFPPVTAVVTGVAGLLFAFAAFYGQKRV